MLILGGSRPILQHHSPYEESEKERKGEGERYRLRAKLLITCKLAELAIGYDHLEYKIKHLEPAEFNFS